MNEPEMIRIPLLNPNEPESLLVEIFVEDAQRVTAGDPLCLLETTKSTQELIADNDGYIHGISARSGQMVRAGDLFCYLTDSKDWQMPEVKTVASDVEDQMPVPDGLRITQRALSLARTSNIDLNDLPRGPLITEDVFLGLLETAHRSPQQVPSSDYDPSAIIIYGGGGHGKSLIDLLRELKIYHLVGVIDDGMLVGTEVMGVPVLGNREKLEELYKSGIRSAVNAVGGIGNVSTRIKVFKEIMAARFTCPTVIHPAAYVESSAVLSSGMQVFPHAYIGSDCQIGFGVIVNTGAIVSHDCVVGNYTNISPGAILAGGVKVGKGVLIGMGVTVNLQVSLGDGSRIGNGSTIKSDVPENGIVRAGSIWPE